jgi:DNA modification methylase
MTPGHQTVRGHTAKDESTDAVLSVWAGAQKCSRTQRRDRYLPGSMQHPAKMLPAIAAQAIAHYTSPGDLVLDPMCGIGTTLVEAIHQGRDAIGVEYEPRWASLARANLRHATTQGATGTGTVITGDARDLTALVPGAMRGLVALVVTSPPYGAWTHGHVRATRNTGRPGVRKLNHRYSADPNNLAHQTITDLLQGFTVILDGCRRLLRPGGLIAVTARPIRVRGELVDLPGAVTAVGQRAGLTLVDRLVVLLCGLRGDHLVSRASFFQMHETRKARTRGIPLHVLAHEDLILFRAAPASTARPDQAASRPTSAAATTAEANTSLLRRAA